MGEIKKSLKAEAIGNLYRTAFFLAQGRADQAIFFFFLKKAAAFLPEENLGDLNKLLENPLKNLSCSQKKYWAEKALDQYKKLIAQIA